MASIVESIGKHLPSSWEKVNSLEVRRCTLDEDSDEFKTVKDQFHCSFSGISRATPKSIVRVQSAHLYGMYLLKKAEYPADVKEMSLWHATSEANAARIIETNFDWRRAFRTRFGQGVSFSPSAKYANQECNRGIDDDRVCILCKVLVRMEAEGDSSTSLPPPGYDTTVGNWRVYVKYADYEFYPEYLLYYKSLGRY